MDRDPKDIGEVATTWPARRVVAHERRRNRILVALDTPATKLAEPRTRTVTGGALACEALIAAGVTTMFGYPGGAALPLYRELARYPALRHVLVRHEQNAAHAADGYARATGRVGVCVATSGPGATNLVTAIADAWMDSTPLVAITGQVSSQLLGIGAFAATPPLSGGMPGMHGRVDVNKEIQECDVLFNVGGRFDDRVTGKASTFAPKAKVIHVDIDPSEIGKNVRVTVPIVGDARTVLRAMLAVLPARDASDWLARIRELQAQHQHRQAEPPPPDTP